MRPLLLMDIIFYLTGNVHWEIMHRGNFGHIQSETRFN